MTGRWNVAARCVPVLAALMVLSAAAGLPRATAQNRPPVQNRKAQPAEITAEEVENSIARAKQFLVSKQSSDGSWRDTATLQRYVVGVSSLATLALVNAGMTPQDEPVARALGYLRSVREPEPSQVYEISLMIMALVAAKDGDRDKPRIITLAQKLENAQIKAGNFREDFNGGWGYDRAAGAGGDNSNSQFAVLGLREAAQAGVNVDREVWKRIRQHWLTCQNGDGGWNYKHAGYTNSTGSMTAAGIATLVIVETMLREENDVNPDGSPRCCGEAPTNDALERGVAWMERNFSVGSNPGGGGFLLYYLYGIERAGRLSGRRFFGRHDWYREGARFLVDRQSQRDGSWPMGAQVIAGEPVVATSFALLFLSKGLAPVLINKLNYAPLEANRLPVPPPVERPMWNQHPNDIRNLTDHISNLPKWPKLLTWQQVDLPRVTNYGGVQDLLQSPILYLSGNERPEFTDQEVGLIKSYVDQGGFVFAVNNCNSAGFEDGVRDLVKRMFPAGDAALKPLPPEHPVYRSEYPLDPEGTELHGVDLGCRTVLIYSPDDHSCMWDKMTFIVPPDRPAQITTRILKSQRVGVNVVAYATGREPPNKLDQPVKDDELAAQDQIERGFVQIAKIRHTGDWNAAPNALRNLLLALNRAAGMVASTKQLDFTADDRNIFKYPVVYMHGRSGFQLSTQEQQQLKEYLSRGNVLFADACCGSAPFDRSFRDLIARLYPDKKLERIPPNHELFSTTIGYDIRRVKRRIPDTGNARVALDAEFHEAEPFLEGIEIDGRYAVIYSKYDISCALERQASVACAGYMHEDAVRIAVNVVRYALLQDISYRKEVEPIFR